MIVPGRILIVDDAPSAKEKAKVDKLINELRENGETVVFSSSIPRNESYLENVRLLILDFLLVPSDEDQSLELLAAIIDKLTKKTQFLVIAIWSKVAKKKRGHVVNDVKQAFNSLTGTELKAKILEPFGKSITPNQLVKRIRKELASLPECALLYEVEASIESARDKTISDIVRAGEIPVIIEALRQEVGGIALSREMTNLFLKVLSRHSIPTETLQKYLKVLKKSSVNIDTSKYGNIHNLQSYYEVEPKERIWTGDILFNKKNQVCIVLSPECDFAQKKIGFIKLVSALRINNDDLMKTEKLKSFAKKIDFKDGPTALQKNILTGNLAERYYSLNYLKDSTGTLYHLVVDFQAVNSIRYRKNDSSLTKAGYKQTCRIDSPLVHHLLQAFSAYSSRIGTSSIPPSVVESAKSKLRTGGGAAANVNIPPANPNH